MFNKSQIAKDQKKAKQPKSLSRPKDIDYVSKMGYRDDSPFNKRPYIDINTPTGVIDMTHTSMPLYANGVYLPPNSGMHQFDTTTVREVPVAEEEYAYLTDDEIAAYRDGGYVVEELDNYKDGGTDIYYPPKHNPANSFAVTDPRSMSSGGSYVQNQITHFQSGGNMDPGNNALELHMFYDKDVYKKQDGGIILELTDDEIEEYKKGGYVVEDISVTSLQDGGKAVRQVKRDQRKAARNFEYNPDAEFSMFTQPGEEELPAYEYPGRTVAIDPIEVKPIEITNRETPELDTTAMAEYYANRAKEAREEKRESLKNTDNITYKKLSRPQTEIVLKDEMNDDMSKALTNAGYYVNQLESGDYEVIANKDIADLIYKKGITANELSTKFNLGDSKTLQQHFQPVYNSAQSMHAKRNVGKIDELINQGYTKDQAIKELAKQGEGTVSGLSNLYGNYAEATYQKNKAEADALTALGVTNIKDLTDYQKNQLMNVAAFKTGAEAKLDAAQDESDFLRTYMPEIADNTAYRGLIGVDASGQPMYGTTAYDKAQNEIAATRKMTDEFKYREGAQAEAAKAILTSSNLTDEQRKQLMENPDKFNEIYQSYVNWMTADQGEDWEQVENPNYDPNADPYDENTYNDRYIFVDKISGEIRDYVPKYSASAYQRVYPGTPKSDFTITSEGTPSWREGQYNQVVNIDGAVQMVYPETYFMGAGAGIAGGAMRAMGKALAYSPVASAPWLNLGTALEADMAYQAFKDEGFVDQAIQNFKEGNYWQGAGNAALGALGLIGPLRLTAALNTQTANALNMIKSDAAFAENVAANAADGRVFYQGASGGTDASKLLTEASQGVLPVSTASEEATLLTDVSGTGMLNDVAKYADEFATGSDDILNTIDELPGSVNSSTTVTSQVDNYAENLQIAKQLQDEGLIAKNVDIEQLANDPELLKTTTQSAIEKANTTYRTTDPNKIREANIENMKALGYDVNDPMQVAQYQATHISATPASSYKRAGASMVPDFQDVIYTGNYSNLDDAKAALGQHGDYITEVRPSMDFSTGTPKSWLDDYYYNRTFTDIKDPESTFGLINNPNAKIGYEGLGRGYKQGTILGDQFQEYVAYIGNRGQQVLEPVRTVKFNPLTGEEIITSESNLLNKVSSTVNADGTAAADAITDNLWRDGQQVTGLKFGGSKKDNSYYEDELTDAEIRSLKLRGYRVEEL